MTRKNITAGAYVASAVLSLAVAQNAFGQAAPTTEPAAAPAAEGEEIVILTPFEVSAADDKGYRATSTLAGTRVRTELKDVGSAVSVVTSEFLQDTGAKNNADLLVYTASTEVAGTGGNFNGTTNVADSNRRVAPQNNTRVRGLDSADNTRDYFMSDIPWDGYNVDRVDIQRGANSILFGLGSPAGVVNSSITGATFANANKVEVRYGSYDSLRGSASFNRVVIPDELAFRFATVADHANYQQKPAYNDDERLFAAVRWDPKFLSPGESKLSLSANWEKGDIKANRPRTTPPIDMVSPWFTDPKLIALRNAGGVNPYYANATSAGNPTIPSAGIINSSDSNYSPWLAWSPRVFDNVVAYYNSPSDETPSYVGTNTAWWEGANPWVAGYYVTHFAQYAQNAGLPGSGDGIYSAKTLSDTSFFNFYKNLLDGDNKREWQDWESVNAHLTHTFLNNRIGYDIAYDHQNYSEGQWSMLSDYAQGITIDPKGWYGDMNADGSNLTKNPGFGRAVVISDSTNNRSRKTERESYRAQIYGELRFSDFMEKGTLTKILGRHNFTALASVQETDTLNTTWSGYITDPNFAGRFYKVGEPNRVATDSIRAVATATYLSPTVLTSMAGANLSRLRAIQSPHFSNAWVYQRGATVADGQWVQAPLSVINQDSGDKSLLYRTANWVDEKVDSTVAVWQGYMFDGTVVPMFGYREDTVVSRSVSARANQAPGFGEAVMSGSNWVLPESGDDGYNKMSGNTKSYGIVVHSPKFINKHLPWGTKFSAFYNKSENWRPAAGRVDMFGDSLAAPAGSTKDYGFTVSTLEDKIVLKVNWYESTVANAGLGGFGWQEYMLGYAETWGDEFATQYRNGTLEFRAVSPAQSDAQVRAEQQMVIDYWFANPMPRQADFYKAWQHTAGSSGQQTPPGMTVTGDTASEGVEFELTAQITKNWSLTANASKTKASYTNLAGAFVDFVADRYAFYNKVLGTQTLSDGTVYEIKAGNIEFWGATAVAGDGIPTGTRSTGNQLVNKWSSEFYGQYKLKRLLEGNAVPELRPWAFNLVTNYSFSSGALKGFNVGGAYRWQDNYILGYAYDATARTYLLDEPLKGGSEDHIDFWVGYERDLSEKLKWRIQLNIRNAFESNKLIPLTVEPRVYQNGTQVRDFETAASRISDGMSWSVTNTFSF